MSHDLILLLIFIFVGMLYLWGQLAGEKASWFSVWLLYASFMLEFIANYGS